MTHEILPHVVNASFDVENYNKIVPLEKSERSVANVNNADIQIRDGLRGKIIFVISLMISLVLAVAWAFINGNAMNYYRSISSEDASSKFQDKFTGRIDQLKSIIIEKRVSNAEVFEHKSSPQYQSLTVIVSKTASHDLNNPDEATMMLQNYALTTIYIATGGKSFMRTNVLGNQINSDYLLKDPSWKNQDGWFESPSVCEDWYGIHCDSSGRYVTAIFLPSNKLDGTLPPELNLMAFPRLETLELANNSLRGSIPISIGTLFFLKRIWLSSNNFDGNIPSSLGNLRNLDHLDLSNNLLRGTIPDSIYLDGLEKLSLSNNILTGRIPHGNNALKKLRYLYLSDNALSGEVQDICVYTYLVDLDLSHNELSGSIPTKLGTMPNLKNMNLDHNYFTGNVPSELGRLVSLEKLDVSFNELSGIVPSAVCSLISNEKLAVLTADCNAVVEQCSLCSISTNGYRMTMVVP
mmetsp:Transcript_21739/g.26595  ORF Transcript_21739/g.26595 Transcript_21739/m.26595 type:complete len:465 (-) Transcript_21739:519-1913(-)